MESNYLSVNTCVVLLSLLLNEVICQCGDDAKKISFNGNFGTFSAPAKTGGKTLQQVWSIEAIKGKRIILQFEDNFIVGDDIDCDFSFVTMYKYDESLKKFGACTCVRSISDSYGLDLIEAINVQDGKKYHGNVTGFDRFCTNNPPKTRIESTGRLTACFQLAKDDKNAIFTAIFNQVDESKEDSITPAGVYIAAGVTALVLMIVIVAVFIICCRRRRLHSKQERENKHGSKLESHHKYDYTFVDNQLDVSEIKPGDEASSGNRDGINSKYYQEIADFSVISENVTDNQKITKLDDNKHENRNEHSSCDVDLSPKVKSEDGTYDKLHDNNSKAAEVVYSYDKPFERTYNTLSTNEFNRSENDDINEVYDKMDADGTYNKIESKGRQLQQKNEDVAGVYDHAHALDDYHKLDIGRKPRETYVDDTYNRITDQ